MAFEGLQTSANGWKHCIGCPTCEDTGISRESQTKLLKGSCDRQRDTLCIFVKTRCIPEGRSLCHFSIYLSLYFSLINNYGHLSPVVIAIKPELTLAPLSLPLFLQIPKFSLTMPKYRNGSFQEFQQFEDAPGLQDATVAALALAAGACANILVCNSNPRQSPQDAAA